MGGIKLPDFTSLDSSRVESAGAPTPQPSEGVARINDITAPYQAGEQFGQQATDAGSKLQDIINVADVNNAMTSSFQPKVQELGQGFYSLSGKQAMDAAPQFASSVQQSLNDTAENLTGQARTMFMRQAQPIVDREMYRASTHAGQQALVYSDQSHEAVLANGVKDIEDNLSGGDSKTALDEATLLRQHEAGYQQSLGIDPASDLGKYRLNMLDTRIKEAVTKSISTLPADQQVALAHSALPPQSSQSSSANSSPYNLGNVKTPQGAVNNTQDFVNPATPADGVALTANTLRNGYQGMTLQQMGAKWTGESPDKVSGWVANVSATSKIAPDAVPNLNDPASLQALLTGIATAEKSPTDRQNFTPDVISKGVSQSLSGAPVNTAANNNSVAGAGATPYTALNYKGFALDPVTVSKIAEAAVANKRSSDALIKDQYEQRLDSFANDPKFISMVQVPDDIKAGFVNEPKAQQYLEARADYNMKNSEHIVDADTLQYGSGFYNLLQNIYSPGGISKPSDLYQYTGSGGQLTIDGFNALKQEMAQKTTPEGQAVADAKSRLFASGAQAIYGQAQNYGLDDPKGEQLHQKWLALTLTDYNNGIKAGKSPTQLLNPESPDYVGKSIAMFQRTPEEQLKDKLNSSPRTLDSVASDLQFGRMSQAQAQLEAPKLIQQIPDKAEREKQALRFGLISKAPAAAQAVRAPQPGVTEPE